MGKKRKSVATRLDEADRTMYSTFCSAANSLSQLYTHAMGQQKVSFQAGERHALEKVYQWILRQHEEGSRLTTADVVAYLQNEIEYGGDDIPISPRLQQPTMQFGNSGTQTSCVFGNATSQNKNSVFSNALSSPIRHSLQHCQLVQNNANQNPEASSVSQNRDTPSFSSNDTSMDMRSDSPARHSY